MGKYGKSFTINGIFMIITILHETVFTVWEKLDFLNMVMSIFLPYFLKKRDNSTIYERGVSICLFVCLFVFVCPGNNRLFMF